VGKGALDALEDVHVDAAAGGGRRAPHDHEGRLAAQDVPGNGSWERWRFVGGTGLLGVMASFKNRRRRLMIAPSS
jgi:hypothetical protein